ncbi:MAG: DUF4105 domain-containing protein [Cytophagales bacterium]|nr:DUF4105 domain-containing protein [Cytophagales bacterium]
MRLKLLLAVVSFFFLFSSHSQNIQLSEQSEVTVLTMGPYQGELYSAFGHSAFRVVDPANKIDWVYNYGVFDFTQQNFYLNFAQGKMVYQLGLGYYEPFRDFYIDQDRHVREQYLNLTLVEKQQFFSFLQNNYRPDNREYFYNYVYDNCATKIRDVIELNLPDVAFDHSKANQGKTIRDLMHDYLPYQPWGEFMIDIGLGMQIDDEAPAEVYMFLPDYVFDAFEDGEFYSADSARMLVTKTVILNIPNNAEPINGWLTPMTFFILLFFVVGFLTHLNMKKGKRTRWIDGLLFGFAGMVGLWLVFLWAATLHLSTWNLDLLWAIPFHFPIVFMMRSKKWRTPLVYYFKIVWIWYVILLLVWALLPGYINAALVPFTLLLLLRSFYISWDLKKKVVGSNGIG